MSKGRAGRPRLWPDKMVASFPEGMFRRIAAVSIEGEDRTDFVRSAVLREVDRRERAAGKQPAAKRTKN